MLAEPDHAPEIPADKLPQSERKSRLPPVSVLIAAADDALFQPFERVVLDAVSNCLVILSVALPLTPCLGFKIHDTFAVERMRRQHPGADPRPNLGGAPCRHDDPHRNMTFQMQVTGKIVGDRRHFQYGFMRHRTPFPLGAVRPGFTRRREPDRKIADIGIFGRGHLPVEIEQAVADEVFHVGLSGGHPNLSDFYIATLFLLPFRLYDEGVAAAVGLHCGQTETPLPPTVGERRERHLPQRHGHLRPRTGFSPNRNGNLPLQDRIIVEQPRGPQLGRSEHRQQTEQAKDR